MNVMDLVNWILTNPNPSNPDWLDQPLTVAFLHKGEIVTSDIVSVCFNGNSIQLNEEDFYNQIHGEYNVAIGDTESNTLIKEE